MIQAGARRLHTWLAWLFVAAVLVQVFLAGLAIFGATDGFGLHVDFGYTVIGLITLGVLLTAVAGSLSRREIGLSLLLLVLYVVQTALPAARASAPVIAALHPVNALVLFALGLIIARRGSDARSPEGSA
ncbi:MAG: hypothetical protein HYX54_00750 [Chloroflexi bacterium]|nr:hypothetical protein [Chloroflexota bacterium]